MNVRLRVYILRAKLPKFNELTICRPAFLIFWGLSRGPWAVKPWTVCPELCNCFAVEGASHPHCKSWGTQRCNWKSQSAGCQGNLPINMDSLSVKKNCRSLEMVTTQVAPDSESTCGTAECVVSLNTNLSNLTNRAGSSLQVGGNSIRVSFNTNLI